MSLYSIHYIQYIYAISSLNPQENLFCQQQDDLIIE